MTSTQQRRKDQMTDANTLTPCPHLESCPWCGCALYAVWRRANPRASCKTEGCFGRKMAVVNLDDPSDVAAWNRRAPAPAPTDAEIDAIADQHKASGYGTVWPHAFARAILAKWGAQPVAAPEGPVARIEGIDEYGPRLEWTQHWVDVGVGAKLYTESQVQAMLAAVPRNAPLYSPDDVAFPVQRCADGTDAPTEPASIAAAEVAAPSAPAREPLTDEQIQEIWDKASGAIPGWSRHIAYARAIEAAHGITAAQKEGTNG